MSLGTLLRLSKRAAIELVGEWATRENGQQTRGTGLQGQSTDDRGKQVATTVHEKSHKRYSSGGATRETATKEADRRGADRHVFTAAAEVVDLTTGARFSTRTTDLGPGGCFVDTLSPLPIGSHVHVSVHKGNTHFQSEGTVVYSQQGLGMGIGFESLDEDQRQALEIWLNELTGGRYVVPAIELRREKRAPKPHGEGGAALVRLVQLLIGKGLMTEAEGASILHDPVL